MSRRLMRSASTTRYELRKQCLGSVYLHPCHSCPIVLGRLKGGVPSFEASAVSGTVQRLYQQHYSHPYDADVAGSAGRHVLGLHSSARRRGRAGGDRPRARLDGRHDRNVGTVPLLGFHTRQNSRPTMTAAAAARRVITKQRLVLIGIAVSGTMMMVSVALRWGLVGGGSWLMFTVLAISAARAVIGRPEDLRQIGRKLTWANTTFAGFVVYVLVIALLGTVAFWLG